MPIIHQKKMAEIKLQGSGGYVIAELTDEQAKKADLGVGKLFLAPVGKLEAEKMFKHYYIMAFRTIAISTIVHINTIISINV